MRHIYTFLFIIFTNLIFAQSNFTCAQATQVVAGNTVVTTINGTQVPNPICADNGTGATRGNWYFYTPSQNYTVTISTDIAANTPRVDTRFHVYNGGCGALNCVGGDDDSGSNYSSVGSFTAIAGTTYIIAWDNRWSSAGFTFQLTEGPYVPPIVAPVTFTNQQITTINSGFNLCVVDMDGDHLDDIVGVDNNRIRIHKQNIGGGFTIQDITTTNATNLPSWSLAAGDYNKDGKTDLMYGGGNGVTFMKSNGQGNAYSQETFPQYVFCQRTNFIDLNNDGNLDAFSCHDVDPNVYFLNNGSGIFTFYQSNVTPGATLLGVHPDGGNYGSIWIDYDNDGDQDLFIAKCRGGAGTAKFNELHRNNGNGTFTDVSVAANMYDPVQTWSSAWADFDNDGDMDALVGASATSDGSHKYMRNNGDGTFTDTTIGTGWESNTSLSIEHIAYDFDNNGFVDVMGGGNTIMFNNGNGTFSPANVGFGVCAVGDLNNDGFLDFQNGSNLKISNGNTNKWIKILLNGVQSNKNGIGARVEIYGAWGKQIRDVRSGEGFAYMSTLNTHFGLGQATEITQVVIKWPSGIIDTINNPSVNQSLTVTEGSTLSNNEFANANLIVFPIPTKDYITIKNNNSITIVNATIYDLNGRKVQSTLVENEQINVQNIQNGTYILTLTDSNQKTYSQKISIN